ncbi:MAG: response regulator [Candidatus Stygibacter frigidus]|nr:response regulator [Candidatus Stygibacter frigidus]
MNKKRILIVDDEQDMHVLIENLLDNDRYEFGAAMNGEEGYNMIVSAKPDLVILDVQMPKMDGFEMFKKLIADKKATGLPVIFLTGIAEKRGAHFKEEDVKKHFNNDLVSYMEKPLDPDKFIDLVDKKLL